MSLFYCFYRCIMIGQLRVDSTELQIIPSQLLLHFQSRRIKSWSIGIFGNDTALCWSLPYKIVIVIDNTLKIVTTIIEFPQFLIDRGLIMEYGDYEFLIDIFAWAGSILKYLFCFFEIDDSKFELLFLVEIDFEFGDVGEFGYFGWKFIWIEETRPRLLMIWTSSICLVDIF